MSNERCKSCGQKIPHSVPVFNHDELTKRLDYMIQQNTIDGFEILLMTDSGVSFYIYKTGTRLPITLNAIDSISHPSFNSFIQMALVNAIGEL